jgi:hypothetical protein
MIIAGATGTGSQIDVFRPKNFLPSNSMGPSAKAQHAIRRSTRLPLEVPVLVTSLDPAAPFSEKCNTTLVNAHGCGLIVARSITQGIQIRLEIVSAKRHTTARVAEVVPLGGDPETWLVGLELDVPGNFWGIEYAPADWKIEENSAPLPEPHSPDEDANAAAKSARPQRWRLTDISGGACYLETTTPFPVDTPILLSIRVLNVECLLEGVVRVSHAQTGIGVEFTGAPAQDQRLKIEELIARLTGNRDIPRIFVGRKEGREAGRKETLQPATPVLTDATPDTSMPDPLLELIREGAALSMEQFLNDLRAQRLGKRRDPRVNLALPVQLSGTDVSGRPLDQRVLTINISRRGALLQGIHGVLRLGDIVSLSRLQHKEQFRVAWVGAEDSPAVGQIGVAAVDPNTSFWAEVLKATAQSDLETTSIRGSDFNTDAGTEP